MIVFKKKSQGCIFWPFPPLQGGGGKRHFLEFGEENSPLEKKKLRSKKISYFFRKHFLDYNFTLQK
jgi:hypothetical protein